eukprot:SAG31_NODE_44769_length_261_cov_0.950617_1_plen_47_part_10
MFRVIPLGAFVHVALVAVACGCSDTSQIGSNGCCRDTNQCPNNCASA